MSAPVFVNPQLAAATVGSVVAVTGAEARHAVTVQRRECGERVDVVNGAGLRASGVIVSAAGDLMEIKVDAVSTDSDAPVTLVQALAKGGRDEQAVESAIELGATGIVPWSAQRSIVQWRGPKADKGRAKWESVVMAATKQSRRALIAPVANVMSTKELASRIGQKVEAGTLVLVLHEDGDTALTDFTDVPLDRDVWLVVGPEGGIAPEEREAFEEAGARTVVLGPHVLRASSAGPAAMAALAAVRGAWSRGSQADAGTTGGLR
ncbi:16S rRNA (uracil(1498)-N(3))-methyltransferase [Demequina sp. B12]|uniref:16S rRNA (uracil(1498)-N(3))-methyltransferase n=1 Tax=Demequina sp. B12 TaxID=2992757 RepID=UPI00237B24E9|nr:16S rRNA (uracil(1498)-N(3))-methyltransferase [Demequina sp. B12]MDE0572846.1 16S rRNA (uracil(1498)-N(3))-methyltransferase [Demequina sp. B12]